MSRFRRQVRGAVEATAVHGPTLYSWFGTPSPRLGARLRRALGPDDAPRYLTSMLQNQLYRDFYCQGAARPTRRSAAAGLPGGTPFVERLAEANASRGQWTPGWEVIEARARGLLVRKGALSLLAGADKVASSAVPTPGTRVRLRFPKDLPGVSPGFYMAVGGPGRDESEPEGIVRWYWHLTPVGALRFLGAATSRLETARLSYRVKVLDDPTRFTRCDAVVLYHARSAMEAVSELLADVYRGLGPSDLEPTVPAFTKPLAPGVALAEDPGDGESFGLHRCRVLAEEILAASRHGARSLDERVADVEVGFARRGISLERPYLNPGSSDGYRLPVRRPRRPPSSAPLPAARRREDPSAGYLDVARALGDRLCREALWLGGRCNWMGFEPDPHHSTEESQRMTFRSLGPDLYAGTSGVGLFLARLAAVTGDAAARRTAVGAVRQALACLDDVPGPSRLGYFTGWTGIAFAAARVGTLTGVEELVDQARSLVAAAARLGTEDAEPDLLCGLAGAIVALTTLADRVGGDTASTLAVRLGEALLARAVETPEGLCWRSIVLPRQPALTGLSHGAAGIGLGLLALFETTGESECREAALRAFAYERSWYDARRRNWPDLRSRARDGRPAAGPLTFSATWCHGAPGIALARLAALGAPGFEACRAEALVALETTRHAVETELGEGGNYSLCHGLAGNADVLLAGAGALGRDAAHFREAAHRVAQTGIERYARRERPWRCGTGGESPGLMLGLAGIGAFYLRMFDPGLPSVLLAGRYGPGAFEVETYMC